MRLALLSSDESKPYFLDELKGGVESKIADVGAEIFKVRKNLDITKKLAALGGFDMVFVAVLYSNENVELKVVIEKLADAELEGVHILKMIERIELPEDYSEKELAELKAAMLSKAEELLISEIVK